MGREYSPEDLVGGAAAIPLKQQSSRKRMCIAAKRLAVLRTRSSNSIRELILLEVPSGGMI